MMRLSSLRASPPFWRPAAVLVLPLILTLALVVSARPTRSEGAVVPGPPPEPPNHPAPGAVPAALPIKRLPNSLFLPLTEYHGDQSQGVNPANRQQSLSLFLDVYLASENVPAQWTGDPTLCEAGKTSDIFQEAVVRRINYFRMMAGMSNEVGLSRTYTRKGQKAALMMSVNRTLSHSPDNSWLCYSKDGADGAANSNLYLGIFGPAAIDGYMRDGGDGNYFAGHRRWILFPQTQEMGTGDVPTSADYPAANALWVFDDNLFGPRPETREPFVAWPPPGFIPYQVVYPRWSFSYAGADFTGARVTMSSGGKTVPVRLEKVMDGYGENTLVWIPANLHSEASWPRPASDTTYSVVINRVKIEGQNRQFEYEVTVFDPLP